MGVRWDSVWGGYTVTTEMDVLASSAGSQLVRARKRVLASVWSGESLHLCCLGSQLEGVGAVHPPAPLSNTPSRQVLKGTHPLSRHSLITQLTGKLPPSCSLFPSSPIPNPSSPPLFTPFSPFHTMSYSSPHPNLSTVFLSSFSSISFFSLLSPSS